MTDVERALREALHAAVDHVPAHPDEREVARRVDAGRRRRRAARLGTAAGAAAALAAVLVATNGPTGAERGVRSPPASATTTTIPTTTTTAADPVCPPPDALPFRPTNLPSDWVQAPYVAAAGVTDWSAPGERIEVWNGARPGGVPEPDSQVESITVLGLPATIGDISDGSSVVVRLGATPCDLWALVAHPGTTRDELRSVAEHLERIGAAGAPTTAAAPAGAGSTIGHAGAASA